MGSSGRPDGEQGEFLRDIGLDIFVPRGDVDDGQRNLIRWRVLRHIAERPYLESASDIDRVVVHAEDEDAGRLVFDNQPPDRLQSADPGQVKAPKLAPSGGSCRWK